MRIRILRKKGWECFRSDPIPFWLPDPCHPVHNWAGTSCQRRHRCGFLNNCLLERKYLDYQPIGITVLKSQKGPRMSNRLSIGYSTCHWCHVMVHESFEDDTVARAINAGLLPVKVDGEELWPKADGANQNAAELKCTGGVGPVYKRLSDPCADGAVLSVSGRSLCPVSRQHSEAGNSFSQYDWT